MTAEELAILAIDMAAQEGIDRENLIAAIRHTYFAYKPGDPRCLRCDGVWPAHDDPDCLNIGRAFPDSNALLAVVMHVAERGRKMADERMSNEQIDALVQNDKNAATPPKG